MQHLAGTNGAAPWPHHRSFPPCRSKSLQGLGVESEEIPTVPLEAVVLQELLDVRLVVSDTLKLLDERIGAIELLRAAVDSPLDVADFVFVIGVGQRYRLLSC